MAKAKYLLQLLWGLSLGNAVTFMFLLKYAKNYQSVCLDPMEHEHGANSMKNSNHDFKLLLIGVMTAPKYFDTRAKAVYETWGDEGPADIRFYSSQGSYSSKIPLTALKDVDDSYPPQKKSMMMLKHMYDNYINTYEWFMRADDDVYIRPDRLAKLLRSVDSKKSWFIGQTGRGNSEEFGLLSLDSDENFCMGGPGVIFSRETLKRVAPFVEECLQHLYTSHEDVELGRCVRRFAGVSCTWNYQMQSIFYHNQSGHSAFTGELKQKEIHEAITLHPVKHPENLYRLHKYFKGLEIRDSQYRSMKLQRDLLVCIPHLENEHFFSNEVIMVNSDSVFFERTRTNTWAPISRDNPTGVAQYSNHNLSDTYSWEFFSGSWYSTSDLNPKRRIGTSLKEGLADVIVEVMELINHYSKERGRLIEFKEILYCYWRFHPVHGIEYILDLLLVYRKYRGHKMTIQVRRHAYIQQLFSGLYITTGNLPEEQVVSEVSEMYSMHEQIKSVLLSIHRNLKPLLKSSENKLETINFVLPLCGRYNTFERFMKIYESECLTSGELTSLTVILHQHPDHPEELDKSFNLLKMYQRKYSKREIVVAYRKSHFSRGRALHYGVDRFKNHDLMFFIDVDMIFNQETLRRIRSNTVMNNSIYFPIVLSMYNPKLVVEQIPGNSRKCSETNGGFWRQFGFGLVSLYKSDYLQVGGFNLMISGWGFEDVTFYDKVLGSSLHIIRTTDPSLIHIFHSIHCDNNLDITQRNMCLGTETTALGGLGSLQQIYTIHKNLFTYQKTE